LMPIIDKEKRFDSDGIAHNKNLSPTES
jgi:hypothetical protein